MTPPDLSPDSADKRRREIVERLGLAVLNRRLATLARARTTRRSSPPAAFRGNQLRAERVTGVLVYAQPDHWKAGAGGRRDRGAPRRRSSACGPTNWQREIAESEADLKLAADGAATRRTPVLAEEIVGTLEEHDVQTAPADDLALFAGGRQGPDAPRTCRRR